jgi:hypothetical protein
MKNEPTPQGTAKEIFDHIEKTQSKEDTDILINALNKVNETKDFRGKTVTSISEKKMKLKNLPSTVDDMESHYKMQKDLLDEIKILEDIIVDIDVRYLPQQEEMVRIAKEKIYYVISPAIFKVKKGLQEQLDSLLLKSHEIIDCFDKAFDIVRTDPRFYVTLSIETLQVLREFNLANSPRGIFDRMTGLNTEVYRK